MMAHRHRGSIEKVIEKKKRERERERGREREMNEGEGGKGERRERGGVKERGERFLFRVGGSNKAYEHVHAAHPLGTRPLFMLDIIPLFQTYILLWIS